MQNNKIIISIIALAITALGALFLYKKSQKKYPYTIGILQTASHPALDTVAQSCKEQIKKQYGNEIKIIEQNAQGSSSTAHIIAHNFQRNTDINAVIAIATTAAQAAHEVIKNKPIIYAAVSDPEGIGINKKNNNIRGIADTINAAEQVKLIQAIAPNASTVGLLYNKGEINAVGTIKEIVPLLEKQTLKVIHFAVTNESEMPQALNAATGKVDIIFAPIDNTVASTIDLIAHKTLEKKIPVVVSDNLLIQQGVLAASGVDYHKSGAIIGERIINLLIEKKQLQDLEFSLPEDTSVHINKSVAEKMGISLESLKNIYQERLEVE